MKEMRVAALASFQVNRALMARAAPGAVFLHCLPAHRGEEVTSSVLDGPRSLVVQQAGNRLHFQKALLYWLLHDPVGTFGQNDRTVMRRHTHPRRRYKTG